MVPNPFLLASLPRARSALGAYLVAATTRAALPGPNIAGDCPCSSRTLRPPRCPPALPRRPPRPSLLPREETHVTLGLLPTYGRHAGKGTTRRARVLPLPIYHSVPPTWGRLPPRTGKAKDITLRELLTETRALAALAYTTDLPVRNTPPPAASGRVDATYTYERGVRRPFESATLRRSHDRPTQRC